MKTLFRHITAAVGMYVSLLGLVLAVRPAGAPFTQWQKVLLVIATVLFLVELSFGVAELSGHPERRFRQGRKQELRIRNFMFQWLKSNGRAVIFTRDLSWVDATDQQMQSLLTQKAGANELTVVLPTHTSTTLALEAAGATVVTYENLDYVIQSRFTLIGMGRAGSRVAVGHSSEGTHVIQIANATDPVFYLAEDLVEIMKRM